MNLKLSVKTDILVQEKYFCNKIIIFCTRSLNLAILVIKVNLKCKLEDSYTTPTVKLKFNSPSRGG